MERVSIEFISNKKDNVQLVRWINNNAITLNSCDQDVEQISKVQRHSRNEKKLIAIRCPNIVSRYRIGIRSEKLWWYVFTWTIDVSQQNAWLLHRVAINRISLLEFRRSIIFRCSSKCEKIPLKKQLF